VSILNLKRWMRQRLKRWRKAIWTITACAFVFMMACLGMPLSNQLTTLLTTDEPAAKETLASLQVWADEIEQQPPFQIELARTDKARIVHTKTEYIGESKEKIVGILKPSEIMQLLNQHPSWEGRIDDSGDVWLENHVAELSETCKQKGYIGLDSTGNLTLFEGKPEQEKVMRTFFQINIKSMETSLPKDVIKQLHDGIRIQDLEEYNSVISTFSDFALDPGENLKH
jgi:forespore regulator of the sigma-K checkpoint